MTQPQSEQQKQRRRGILKAVAGTPVIFTLSAGTNVAAASISCQARQTSTPVGVTAPTTNATNAPDQWVRYRVENVKIKISSTILTNVFRLSDSGPWYRVDGNVVSSVTGTINPGYGIQSYATKQYYYLLVDQSKYSPSANAQSFVYLGSALVTPVASTSCWNSINPVSQPDLTSNVVN